MKTTLFSVAVCGLFALSSCTTDQDAALGSEQLAPTADVSFIVDENEDGVTNLPPVVNDEIALADIDAQFVDLTDLTEVQAERPDGTTETAYLTAGDIHLTKQQVDDMRNLTEQELKQYRTYNLVSDNNISVIGYTGGSNALTSKARTALSWAVNNYNNLNTSKNFSLSFGARTNADIVVFRSATNNGAGGIAGFPSGGQPYKWVNIYRGMENYDTNTNEHVITHEIGHCMGLRHTDWFSRASCGQSGESANPDGAVQIPGTPSSADQNSIMLACFSDNEDGEFSNFDRIALEYLY